MTIVHRLGYGVDDPKSQGTTASKSKKFISSEKPSDSLWSPKSLQFHA
jgi:hypothetical protein